MTPFQRTQEAFCDVLGMIPERITMETKLAAIGCGPRSVDLFRVVFRLDPYAPLRDVLEFRTVGDVVRRLGARG